MNYEELLHEYFDDGLDEQRESILFAALAHDASLRREFNDYVSLRLALQSEATFHAPPTALSASVFASLGYSLASPPTTEALPPVGKTSRNLMSYMPYLLTSVFSSAFTILVVFLFLRPSSVEQKIPLVIQSEKVAVGTTDSKLPQSIETAKPVSASTEKLRREGQRVETKQLLSTSVEVSEPAHNANEERMMVKRAELCVANQVIGDVPSSIQPPTHFDNLLTDAIPLSDLGVEITARSFISRSLPSVNLTDNTNRPIDFAISALYALSDNHAVGIEFGRETFGQEYRQTLNGGSVTVRQNPMLW